MIGSFFPALREPWIVSLAMPEKKKKKTPLFKLLYPILDNQSSSGLTKKLKIKKKNIGVGGILNDLLRKFLQFSGYMYNQKV